MFKTIKCKNCGASSYKKINNDTYECKYCGMQIRKKHVKCDECEKRKIEEFEHKEHSENDSSENVIKTNVVNQKKAFALIKLFVCLFCGYLGIHRFMEGKVVSGIIYFCTYGLFGIGIIVDIFRLAKEFYLIKHEGK